MIVPIIHRFQRCSDWCGDVRDVWSRCVVKAQVHSGEFLTLDGKFHGHSCSRYCRCRSRHSTASFRGAPSQFPDALTLTLSFVPKQVQAGPTSGVSSNQIPEHGQFERHSRCSRAASPRARCYNVLETVPDKCSHLLQRDVQGTFRWRSNSVQVTSSFQGVHGKFFTLVPVQAPSLSLVPD